jgi:hypothetical protein
MLISMQTSTAIAASPSIRHDPAVMLTGLQIRAARALLRWSHQRLATESRTGIATVQRAESEDGIPSVHARTLNALQTALERGGVIFVAAGENKDGGDGVRLRKPNLAGP